jgi:hypothetical protein
MGTWFGGRVDLTIRMAEDGNSVTIKLRLKKLAVRPREVRLRLRSGDGRPLVTAEINGQKAKVLPGDTILLPVQLEGELSIVGGY